MIDAQGAELWTALELPADWRQRIARMAVEEDREPERSSLEARRRRLVTAFVDGAPPEPDYRRQLAAVDADLAWFAAPTGPRYEDAASLVSDLPQLWARANADERRRLLAPLVDAGYVDVTEQRIEGFDASPSFDGLLRTMPRRHNDVLHIECAAIGGMVETGENPAPSSLHRQWQLGVAYLV